MRRTTRLAGMCAVLLVLAVGQAAWGADAAGTPAARAKQILEATDVQGGLIVHVGCGPSTSSGPAGKLTAALRVSDAYLVHGLDTDSANVTKARKHFQSLGIYGEVSADRFDGARLPYIDNLVNLVVSADLGKVAMSEVMRVLAPGGVAYLKLAQPGKAEPQWARTVKPRPGNIDEWTHYLHDASNNAVAHDNVVAVPSHIQWVGAPKWARHHNYLSSTSAMVSTGGRVFAIMDEGPPASLAQPPKWSLVARDAFNGVVLWTKPLGKWEDTHRPFRSGPTELARRLVAVGDRVYVTLGYGQGVTALDTATGKVVRTYAGTAKAIEILHEDGVLYVVTGPTSGTRGRASSRRGSAAGPADHALYRGRAAVLPEPRGPRLSRREVRQDDLACAAPGPAQARRVVDADGRRIRGRRSLGRLRRAEGRERIDQVDRHGGAQARRRGSRRTRRLLRE